MLERKRHLVLLVGLCVLGAAASPAEKPADSTRASLRHFVTTTHWDEKSLPLTMPNPSLTDSQIADVVSYILSLRK
jgi:cytochrome c1